MNSVGQGGDRKSFRVILLLAVGLTAFSSAMKELNLLREFSRDASNMVASWSNAVVPAPPVVAPAQAPPMVAKAEVCERQALQAAEPVDHFQSGGSVAQAEVKIKDVGKTVVAERSARRNSQVMAVRSHRSAGIELMELRKQARREADLKVMIMADSDGEAEIALPSDFEFKLPKVKTFRRQIRITPEERDVLKNLNRSLNLRSAG
jgi:hypothetical protein